MRLSPGKKEIGSADPADDVSIGFSRPVRIETDAILVPVGVFQEMTASDPSGEKERPWILVLGSN
jgi:hypothetical protein